MDPNSPPFTTGTQSGSNPGGLKGDRPTGTQSGSNPGGLKGHRPGREDQAEGLVGEAVDTARKVYNEGERYLREGYNRLPADMDRYVSRPVQENPLIAVAIAGVVGYLIAYIIHGSGSHRSEVPDYVRMRDYRY
jgi:hypothetical protein